eukprot:TRINITY_DN5403_c0_g1_i1.p1 TRINITY_DN5403_c0_g1~~TRINITY_DN5403_c0_g1_i1.p1  ORF type:complete len:359 (+),score=101.74 TRINITY_DN5403_c0_g1_i1:65-1078(+)
MAAAPAQPEAPADGELRVLGPAGEAYHLSRRPGSARGALRGAPAGALRRALSRETGLPAGALRLRCRGRELADDETPAGAGLGSGEALQLLVDSPPPAGCGGALRLRLVALSALAACGLAAPAWLRAPEKDEPPQLAAPRRGGPVADSIVRWQQMLGSARSADAAEGAAPGLPDAAASAVRLAAPTTPGRAHALTAEPMGPAPPRAGDYYEPQQRLELPGGCLDVYEAFGWQSPERVIRKQPSGSAGDCCELCAAEPRCAAWTHYNPFLVAAGPADFVCTLYSAAEGATFCRAESRCTSGKAPPRPGAPLMRREPYNAPTPGRSDGPASVRAARPAS